jgi:cob(I)alamin adenosyltransferase
MMVKKVGFSTLLDSVELTKSDLHFDVLGALDECSAALAVARSVSDDAETKAALKTMQQDLSKLMGAVAGVTVEETYFKDRLAWIEGIMGELKQGVVLPKGFIVPGENSSEAYLDLARTVARRAERTLTRFAETKTIFDSEALQYLNRISSVLYLYEIKARNAGR